MAFYVWGRGAAFSALVLSAVRNTSSLLVSVFI